MLDAGEKEPRCVESCPTGAIVFGDLDDSDSEIAKLVKTAKPEVMHPEFDLKEKVTYIDLPKKFVAGTVILSDIGEAAAGARVNLTGDGEKQEAVTDGWGDFEFEKLEDNTAYTVRIELEGYATKEVNVKTRRDVFLGDIALDK
jgi:ferredoxin